MTTQHWDHRAHLAVAEACMRHRVPFFWRGPGTMLVEASGLEAVLRQLSASGHRVIGLEGFEMRKPEIRPRPDLIYDADRSPMTDALDFSAAWPKDVWVDIVLDIAAGGP